MAEAEFELPGRGRGSGSFGEQSIGSQSRGTGQIGAQESNNSADRVPGRGLDQTFFSHGEPGAEKMARE